MGLKPDLEVVRPCLKASLSLLNLIFSKRSLAIAKLLNFSEAS